MEEDLDAKQNYFNCMTASCINEKDKDVEWKESAERKPMSPSRNYHAPPTDLFGRGKLQQCDAPLSHESNIFFPCFFSFLQAHAALTGQLAPGEFATLAPPARAKDEPHMRQLALTQQFGDDQDQENNDPALPLGWREVFDKSSERSYFIQETTGDVAFSREGMFKKLPDVRERLCDSTS
jgi:hypothetical protein